eukprot:CAMPEP_0117569932 /NCGR_PEP_ID=MMETSP0784-20121206/58924_1 /TAXON_ID=39447 /ORGANISM="" /LENGTH=145 /DNA_ID=CAMNT_0005367943 /DNA_START=98 /DNA_END=535 /DNA_ORIENTATION=+
MWGASDFLAFRRLESSRTGATSGENWKCSTAGSKLPLESAASLLTATVKLSSVLSRWPHAARRDGVSERVVGGDATSCGVPKPLGVAAALGVDEARGVEHRRTGIDPGNLLAKSSVSSDGSTTLWQPPQPGATSTEPVLDVEAGW